MVLPEFSLELDPLRLLRQRCLAQTRDGGSPGPDHSGSDKSCDLHIHPIQGREKAGIAANKFFGRR